MVAAPAGGLSSCARRLSAWKRNSYEAVWLRVLERPDASIVHDWLCRNDFFSTVKAVAKKVQGSLPIVGLVSRLAAPEGGFDELVS